ncbi:MAG: hypothetical protein DMG58_03570 [Acidobacteria bacterium]|nr:MAG: hypothetical protein DMG58_03570 [Acidobacteriota bacterium]PYU67789.1 MAG: hypothetical protein DMG52_33180 [Acidobacteriota bacterium]
MLNTKTPKLVLVTMIPAALLCGCGRTDSKFDSKEWKTGGASYRGAMLPDLTERGLLIGRTRTEVAELLGKPDMCGAANGDEPTVVPANCSDEKVNWYGYNVVTIPRCYFWKCYLNVNFDPGTNRVEGIAVSD